VKNKILSISGQFINILFLLLINRFFYQEFGLFFLGLYNAAIILTQFILIFSDLGISASLTNQISKYKSTDKTYTIQLAQSGFLISIILFLLFIIIIRITFNTDYIFSLIGINNYDDLIIIYYLIIGMLIAIPRNQIGSIIMGYNLPHIWSYLNLFSTIINSLGLLTTLMLQYNNNIIGYVYITTNIFSLMIFILYVGLNLDRKILLPFFHYKSFKRIINFSFKIYLGSLISFFSSFIDRILVFSLISINYLGIYSIVHNISQKIEIIGSSVATTIFPELSSNVNKSNRLFTSNVKEWLDFTNFISFNLGIFIFFISEYIYYFIFSEFPTYEIRNLFLLVIIAYIIKSACNLIIWVISSINKPEIQIYYGLINSLSYILIVILFFSNLDITILASSFLLSNFISLMFLVISLNINLKDEKILGIFINFVVYFVSSLIFILILYFVVNLFIRNIYQSLFIYSSYFVSLLFIFFKTNLLINYKNNQIIKFILQKIC